MSQFLKSHSARSGEYGGYANTIIWPGLLCETVRYLKEPIFFLLEKCGRFVQFEYFKNILEHFKYVSV